MTMFIAMYMLIGFLFIKPKELRDFHWTWVNFSDGFFLFDIPIWLWIIIWIFWFPLTLMKWLFGGFR